MHDNLTYTLEELSGKILSYGKSASDDSYLFPVNLEIGNHAGFARCKVVSRKHREPLALQGGVALLLQRRGS